MKLLKPVRSEKVWGYEDWIASTHPNGPQSEFIELVKDYPLLVKIIQADDTLSIQVHPDDETAVELEGKGARGKTECWYILDAKPGAKLVYGLKKDYSKAELEDAIKNNTLEELLNQVEVKKGDFIFIPSGTVHAICGGLRLLEVQQSCDITYRLYDWGRGREIHIEKGIEAVLRAREESGKWKVESFADGEPFDLSQIKPLPGNFECQYFELIHKTVAGGWSFFVRGADKSVESIEKSGKCFELLYVASGKTLSATFTTPDGVRTENMYLYPEQIYCVVPGEKVTIEGKGEVIRIKAK